MRSDLVRPDRATAAMPPLCLCVSLTTAVGRPQGLEERLNVSVSQSEIRDVPITRGEQVIVSDSLVQV